MSAAEAALSEPTDLATPRLIVGLGNPSPRYHNTRHNIGAQVAISLAQRLTPGWSSGIPLTQRGARARLFAQGRLPAGSPVGYPVIVMRPWVFMNSAGSVVAAARAQLAIPPENVIVVHDDMELAAGVVGVKSGGSERGHNGLRSISRELGSRDYLRVRMGIGNPNSNQRAGSRHARWGKSPAKVTNQARARAAHSTLSR